MADITLTMLRYRAWRAVLLLSAPARVSASGATIRMRDPQGIEILQAQVGAVHAGRRRAPTG